MAYQNLFETIVNITGFTPLQTDMQEIISAYEKDLDELLKSNTLEQRKKNFACFLGNFKDEYPREMLVEFYNYWSEHSPTGKKMRFEKEKVFDVKKRLLRWSKNQKQNKVGKVGISDILLLNKIAKDGISED